MSKNIFPFSINSISSQQILSNWVAFSLEQGIKRKQHCEIEIRLGEFILKNRSHQNQWALLQKLSLQSLIILRTNSEYNFSKITILYIS